MAKVDGEKIKKWVENVYPRYIPPPGCETVYAPSSFEKDSCCIGIVNEHRFAFYYWAKYAEKWKDYEKPILITIDTHDDVGADSDVIPEDLDNLDLKNDLELSLFAWTRLAGNNDGQIRPAIYLDLFSDVFVLLKEESFDFDDINSYICKDSYNEEHKIGFFYNHSKLLNSLPDNRPIYLDIDLDYFTKDHPEKDDTRGAAVRWSDEEIINMISMEGEFAKAIIPNLVGMTIALEPEYSGGLKNSFEILNLINQEWFDNTLMTDECKWKNN